MVELLIKLGADLNSTSSRNNQTPLHIAAQMGQLIDLIKFKFFRVKKICSIESFYFM